MAAPSQATKVPVTLEVCQKAASGLPPESIKQAVEALMKDRGLLYHDGPLRVNWAADPMLGANVDSIRVANTGEGMSADEFAWPGHIGESSRVLLFWQIRLHVVVYQLNDEGAAEDVEGEDEIAMYKEWSLPAVESEGLWEALLYESDLKRRLLKYSASALVFSNARVDSKLIAWNRVVLLHGPPGTGKTSLCKALAHKLAIKFNSRYSQSQLIEVNAHSLFSKWFSESGKLVTKLFAKITELVEDEDSLVFVLIDEVESLTAARKAAVSGSEPSDAIRVVNALLTQIDALKQYPNVMVLTTTNITQAVDLAFVDRADIKVYIGPPAEPARYEILRTCVQELIRSGIVQEPRGFELPTYPQLTSSVSDLNPAGSSAPASGDGMVLDVEGGDNTAAAAMRAGQHLLQVAHDCEGYSGRILRKLPFLAHTQLTDTAACDCVAYLEALGAAAAQERHDRNVLSDQEG